MWGAGALGSCAIAILRALYPTVEIAVVARWDAQAALAKRFGAHHVIKLDGPKPKPTSSKTSPRGRAGSCCRRWRASAAIPMCHPGFVDVVYDTIAKPETFEVAVRVLKARGTLVKSGVTVPGRWEWSPLYFKEITWVGSNAFGVEEVDGVRKHGIAHYIDLVGAAASISPACSPTRSASRTGSRRSTQSPSRNTPARSRSPSTRTLGLRRTRSGFRRPRRYRPPPES